MEGPTRIQEAINLARAHKPARIVEGVGLLAGDPITLHVYSDGRIADAEQAAAGFEDTVDYVRIGKPDSENLGIVTLRAERSFEKAERLNIFVGIAKMDKIGKTDADFAAMLASSRWNWPPRRGIGQAA